MSMAPTSPVGLTEEFVDIIAEKSWPEFPHDRPKDFYSQWVDKVSAPTSWPAVFGADALKRIYTKHSLVVTEDNMLDILLFPDVQATPLDESPLITNLFYVPLARKIGVPGVLIDRVQFGIFKMNWKQHEFIAHIVSYPSGFATKTIRFILHEGHEDTIRLLLSSVGAWAHGLHNEIWVFDGNIWTKSRPLWSEVQKANWDDIILKDKFREALQKDVFGFFDSETIYKDLAIPWKRGLIMHGPPGNGKTITLKAFMKTCSLRGFLPLYVRSFKGWAGEEAAIKETFRKAREVSPCLVIFEDLDSLINDHNRSFFLNQLDGLEGNDGFLIIGTTNHFEKLDPSISRRPSRFDRKYIFDDPDQIERKSYAHYWQKKLQSNKDIHFPDSLAAEFVALTAGFSFAYLKEAFVSSLILLAAMEGKEPSFGTVLKEQIAELRKQLNKPNPVSQPPFSEEPLNPQKSRNHDDLGTAGGLMKDTLALLRGLPVRTSDRVFTTSPTAGPVDDSQDQNRERSFRDLIDSLSARLDGEIVPQASSEKRCYVASQPLSADSTL